MFLLLWQPHHLGYKTFDGNVSVEETPHHTHTHTHHITHHITHHTLHTHTPHTQEEDRLHSLLDKLRSSGGVLDGHEEDMKKWPIAKVRHPTTGVTLQVWCCEQ